MDSIIHKHLNQLRILGKIREGQKISTTKGIEIYDDNFKSWFNRFWSRDSRYETIRVLTEIFKLLETNIYEYIKNIKYEERLSYKSSDSDDDSNMLDHENNIKKRNQLLVNVAENLADSVVGIENLSHTYRNQYLYAAFDSLVYDYILITYTNILQYLSPSLHTVKLTKNITYSDVVIYKYPTAKLSIL